MVSFIVCDQRDDGMWSWTGKKMCPISEHEPKAYQSEVTAIRIAHKLRYRGVIVGELRIRRDEKHRTTNMSAEPEPRIYKLVRCREHGTSRTIRKNVTLSEAQEHCSKPETRGIRAGVRWFDAYEYMPGCKPKHN